MKAGRILKKKQELNGDLTPDLATGLSVFVLRHKEPQALRPYKIPGFPVPTIVFCAFSLFMLYSSVTYTLANKPIGLITLSCVLMTGVIVYWVTDVRGQAGMTKNIVDK